MIISGNAQKFLKVLHLLAVCFWVGGCLAQLILYYAGSNAESDGELFGILRGSRFISTYIVVYLGAFGSFFTGLAYSMCTNRGFFKHKWVIIKWAATVYLMVSGTAYLGPWSVQMLESAQGLGRAALADPVYLAAQSKLLILATVNMLTLVILTFVSVYKPWEAQEAVRLLNRKLRGKN